MLAGNVSAIITRVDDRNSPTAYVATAAGRSREEHYMKALLVSVGLRVVA